MDKAIIAGVVPQDSKALAAWERLRDYLSGEGGRFDFVSFSSYERQVDFLLRGRIDIAWNTPAAHLRVQERTRGESISLCMRDCDRDVRSLLLVREDAWVGDLRGLAGKRVAVAGADSVTCRILPLYFLKKAGVDPGRVEILPSETTDGRFADETDEDSAIEALLRRKADAGFVTSSTWERRKAEGGIQDNRLKPLWVTPPFDYCIFDAVPPLWSEHIGLYMEALENIRRKLYELSWEDPGHREILRLLGQKRWLPPREKGYDSLREALKEERSRHGNRQYNAVS